MGVELEDIKSLLEQKANDTKEQFEKLTKAHEKLDGYVAKINDDIEKNGKEYSESKDAFQKQVEKVAGIEDKLDAAVEKMTRLPSGCAIAKTVGQMFTEDDVLKGIDSNTFGGKVSKTFEMSLLRKAITSAPGSAGAGVEPTLRPGVVDEPDQQVFVRDLLMTLTTASNSIEWVEVNGFTNSAAPQAGEGAAKAESELTLAKQNTPVQTLAHFMHASRQVLDDMAALRGIIDQKLRYGLRLEEEEQLLLGDGVGNNLSGLVPSATPYDVAGLAQPGDTYVDQLRRAILQVSLSKFPTTAIVLNPADWCDIELMKTSDNAYLFSNPTAANETRIWGKRVVEGLSMTTGEFLLGAFGMAATLWDREQSTIRIAETDQDDFIKNMVKVLAEERLALTVEQPLGLVTGTLTVTP